MVLSIITITSNRLPIQPQPHPTNNRNRNRDRNSKQSNNIHQRRIIVSNDSLVTMRADDLIITVAYFSIPIQILVVSVGSPIPYIHRQCSIATATKYKTTTTQSGLDGYCGTPSHESTIPFLRAHFFSLSLSLFLNDTPFFIWNSFLALHPLHIRHAVDCEFG